MVRIRSLRLARNRGRLAASAIGIAGLVFALGFAVSANADPARGAASDPHSSDSPSGEPMPQGDLPGWKQIFADDFTEPAAVGQFPGDAYGDKWKVYPDGWNDTSGNGTYYPSKVVSVADGMLTKHLHTEDGMHMVAALLPKLNGSEDGQSYGRYSIRFKSDAISSYKTAWLLWPDSEQTPEDGETDFPEGDLDGKIGAFMHHADPDGGQDEFDTDATYTDWHTATIEWTPGKVVFLLDDKEIGTSTEHVPSNPMHWVIQTESCIGCGEPDDDIEGDVSIDWAVAYSME
ncbi:MAG TPA: glycoside hydrolase family 16 protein [Stackebrandtia sp.]|jgi:beta-glucanase (GH16 family)|uniref:glycoside hydrolase family 16 protein n=1 Tax=Stackebrandtia sp. TaxID=2023065 RepID=UPI002D3300B6|nr:glycoside hydrolase family 16 protein [Stackebrandtia sp.]HZE37257.1 glycoside hydrolase family 16 protein [Stackebrandtia sp.]